MEEDYDLVKPEVVEYIKTEIFPRYEKLKGHGLSHIQNVIRRSLVFAKRINSGEIAADFDGLPESLRGGKMWTGVDGGDGRNGDSNRDKINYDMVFVIAAYHDLGRERNNKLHHLVSAGMLLLDERLWELFNREELRVMADAVMDHRASNNFEPSTIYGKIVSSADRDTDWREITRRAYAYNRSLCPENNHDETLEKVREKLWIKFGQPDAYGAKKMFFENPEYEAMIRKFQEIASDAEVFRKATREVLKNVDDK